MPSDRQWIKIEGGIPHPGAIDVGFPRFESDVATRKRTLFHLPITQERVTSFVVGASLLLFGQPAGLRAGLHWYAICATVIRVDQVRLLDNLDADLPKMNHVDREIILAGWDRLYAELPACTNPDVLRIEFEYRQHTDAAPIPEWALAG